MGDIGKIGDIGNPGKIGNLGDLGSLGRMKVRAVRDIGYRCPIAMRAGIRQGYTTNTGLFDKAIRQVFLVTVGVFNKAPFDKVSESYRNMPFPLWREVYDGREGHSTRRHKGDLSHDQEAF